MISPSSLPQILLTGVAAVVLLAGCSSTGDLPEVNEEGMNRVEAKRVDAAYVNPDADFSEFNRFAIAEVDVAFRRNWLRDQERRTSSHRVTQEDADRIKSAIAESSPRSWNRAAIPWCPTRTSITPTVTC